MNLDAFVATSIEGNCPVGVGGITLTEDQFEDLQTIGQDSKLVCHEIITQDRNIENNGHSRDSDNELTEQI